MNRLYILIKGPWSVTRCKCFDTRFHMYQRREYFESDDQIVSLLMCIYNLKMTKFTMFLLYI